MSKPFYEEGLHVGRVLAQAVGKTQTGKPQLAIRVKVLGIPVDETSHTAHRQQLERTIYMTVTEKTVGFLTENLRTIGFNGEKISQFDPNHPDHVSVVDNQVYLWCSYETRMDSEELRERWQISKGVAKLDVKPLAAKEMRELDSLFAKSLKSAPAATKAQPKKEAVKPNQHGVEITDDDLPADMYHGDDGRTEDDGDPGWG